MAGFRYRLQQVFDLRERKKKEQEQKVIQAQRRVREIELLIEEKKNEIKTVRHHMMTSHHTMMSAHDEYIHHLNQELDALYQDLAQAQQQLAYEKQLLVKAQADLEALIKHKEKMHQEYLEEEKRKEMKQLDEVAGQRYFRGQLAQEEDDLEDALLAQQLADEEALEVQSHLLETGESDELDPYDAFHTDIA